MGCVFPFFFAKILVIVLLLFYGTVLLVQERKFILLCEFLEKFYRFKWHMIPVLVFYFIYIFEGGIHSRVQGKEIFLFTFLCRLNFQVRFINILKYFHMNFQFCIFCYHFFKTKTKKPEEI